jgi:peptidoglycan-N-acetylglucosamine deacetylase
MSSHTTKLHQIFFPSILWKMNSPDIFLTFDDGPHPVATPIVLKILQANKIKGTFFMSGSAVKQYPSLVKEVEAEKHSIGIHAYNHTRSIAYSKKTTLSEILQTEEAITQVGAHPAKLFRPPYGFFTWNTISAAKQLEYKLVMWSTSTGDYRKDWSNDQVCVNALTKLATGAILVFHDNELTKTKVQQILPRVITGIQERGLGFGSIK